MTLIPVYDAITAENIPPNAQAAMGYAGPFGPANRFVDYLAIAARFPVLAHTGRVMSIAAQRFISAQWLDMETGDATPDDFPAWHQDMKAKGVWNPGGYASLSNWPAIHRIMARAGISDYRTNAADWTGTPHIPNGFDMCQWANRGTVDVSLAKPSAFPPQSHPHPAAPHGLLHAAVVFDADSGRWHVARRPGVDVKLGGLDRWASAELQVNEHRGEWRSHPMPFDAPPMGGK